MTTKPENVLHAHKDCSHCGTVKAIDQFYAHYSICCECNNAKRRLKYRSNEEHRKKLIQSATEFKHQKVLARQQKRQEEQLKLGLGNKKCKYCNEIKVKERFRYNRLKCKDCERDDPVDKFKRVVRSRIFSALRGKTKHTIEYLGCNPSEYLKWLLQVNPAFTLENRGTEWHIDHVIPLHHFDLSSEEQQLIAFNWRNTMPLSPSENLSKNSKIIKSQVEQHYRTLIEYHTQNKLDLPQVYIDLFAKHLVAGSSWEPLLPLTYGNVCEELG